MEYSTTISVPKRIKIKESKSREREREREKERMSELVLLRRDEKSTADFASLSL